MKNKNNGIDKAIVVIEDNIIGGRAIVKATYEYLTKKYFRLLSTFSEERFIDRLNLFTHETFRTEEEIEEFWKSIDNKNKSTLLSLISKAMTATEDIQAFLLAKLFEKIQNNEMELSYLDKVLFSNIELLIEEDFEILYFYTKNNEKTYHSLPLKIKVEDSSSFSDLIIKKFITLGILLNETEQQTENAPLTAGGTHQAKIETDFKFSFTDYSFELMNYLEEYFDDKSTNIIEKYSISLSEFDIHNDDW